ncbi:efflux RND transporter permease subunit [Alkalihalobacterium alkalinitrilicum]|uniref:efflux RND transporter permease subunit n=1 Tax=Alkalihalobacterium alkalinitrilicum TaxID=427920 RepID=UPI000995C983|nr:efflux RND transporter permease subunit [Alkalihalobacterium alkalinitrilicum]
MFDWLIKKSKITLMLLFFLMLIGLITFYQLPQREIPEISLPIATVSTVFPGANPETVERFITVPIEEEIERVEGISAYSSFSASSVSTIVLELEEGVDQENVLTKVTQSMLNISFPEGTLPPTISDDRALGALSSYHFVTEESYEELYYLQPLITEWQRVIESISGVKATIVKGIPNQELLLKLDQDVMNQLEIYLPSVIDALEGEFDQVPLGKQEINGRLNQLTLPVVTNIDQLGELVVGFSNGEPVQLNEIGEVEIRYEQPTDIITYEGKFTVSFTIIPESGIDVPSLHRNVDEKMKELSQALPATIELDLFYTQNSIVTEIFSDLAVSFIIAVIVVIIVTLLGLNFISAIIVALAIPTSILLGLIPLPYLGVDLNQISIIGFIIAIGILVDDAIVVNDNIERRYKLGDSALEGALIGTREVRVSIITSTLAIVFTFLPLVFISGSGGDFIRALPSVLITTIIASTIISLTLVPIFQIWRHKKRKAPRKFDNGLLGTPIDKLANWYADKILGRIVLKPWRIGIFGLALCTVVYGLVPFIPVVFFPSADRQEVTVDVTAPIEMTIEQTDDLLVTIEESMRADEAILEVSRFTGGGLPPLFGSVLSGAGENTGQLLVRVDKDIQSAEETISKWSDILQEEFPSLETKLTTIEAGPPVGAPIAIKVSGKEMQTILDIVEDLKNSILTMEETRTVVDDVGDPWPTILFEPDREKMNEHGITMRDISQQIRLVTEGIPVGQFDDGFNYYDMRLVIQGDGSTDELDLSQFEISGRGEEGSSTLLNDLLVEKRTENIQRIPHENGIRTVTLRVYPREDKKTMLETNINDYIQGYSYNEEYSITIGGETEARSDFFIEVGKLFIIVIFLIYIVMAVQFYSLSTPILVMSTVYLAISGAVIGLFITQTGLGFMAMMGVVSLAGIVVRNSVVLIEFIEQRMREGYSLTRAVIEAGRARLRPIILTALTAIAALIPIALSGDVLFTPLAISIMSGIFFSTFFTLILVPALYTAISKRKKDKMDKVNM